MGPYQIIVLPEAEEDLAALDPSIRHRCLAKLAWLAAHPERLGQKPLRHLPPALHGLQSERVGDWRLLYWLYPPHHLLKVYGVRHRSQVYKHL